VPTADFFCLSKKSEYSTQNKIDLILCQLYHLYYCRYLRTLSGVLLSMLISFSVKLLESLFNIFFNNFCFLREFDA